MANSSRCTTARRPSWATQPWQSIRKTSATQFIGRKVVVPMLGRLIPVIADDYVTREFGTGALKITPAMTQ